MTYLNQDDTPTGKFKDDCQLSAHDQMVMKLIGTETAQFGLEAEDQRVIPDLADVKAAMGDVLYVFEELTRGTKIEDDIVDILSSIVTSLHYVYMRVERKQDHTQSEIKVLVGEQDGSEIKDTELLQKTRLFQQTNDRAEAIENIRDVLAKMLEARYHHSWTPPSGSYVSEHSNMTLAVVEARDFIKAREARQQDARLPEGTRIGFAGGKDFQDVARIWKVLDKTREQFPDMVLVHGGAPGAEHIARKWAETRKVRQIVCTPDWKKHAKAAPFRRNDVMLGLDLRGLIAASGNGITDNLIDKAKEKHLRVKILAG